MANFDLRGFTVAITADRRREEQAALLERMGLEARMFPLLRTEAEAAGALQALTARLAVAPPDFLVANTGFGMRSWMALALEWGCRDGLVAALGESTTIAARGAKALGELRKVGLDAAYKAPGETLDEVVRWLLQRGVEDKSIVVQLHGEPSADAVNRLRGAGANVTGLPIYRMSAGGHTVARALVQAVAQGAVDALTFTAAPQVDALFRSARADGAAGELLVALNRDGVVAACIGEVCAAAATSAGIRAPLVPEHPRLGSLSSALGAHLAERQWLLVGQHGEVKVSGGLVHAEGGERWLEPAEQRLLRALIARGGLAAKGDVEPDAAGAAARLSGALDGALQVGPGELRLRGATVSGATD